MIVIIGFRVKLSIKVGFENIVFMIYLSCLRNKTYLQRLQKGEIETLNTKVTKSHSILSLNHKVIVT